MRYFFNSCRIFKKLLYVEFDNKWLTWIIFILINLNLAAPIHFMKADLNSLQHSSNFCLENFHCLLNLSIFSYWNFRSLLFLYPVTHLRLVQIDHVCDLRRPSFKFRLYQVLKRNWPCTIMKIEPKRLKAQIKNPILHFLLLFDILQTQWECRSVINAIVDIYFLQTSTIYEIYRSHLYKIVQKLSCI